MTISNSTLNNSTIDEGKKTNHITINAPAFEADIDPVDMLEILDEYIKILTHKPSETDLQKIKAELQAMEIITMPAEDGLSWINEQAQIHKIEMKRTLGARVGHLLKTKGEWKGKNIKSTNLEIKTRTVFPMPVILHPEAVTKLKNGELTNFAISVMGLRATIEDVLSKGAPSLGIFYKPNSIVQMNRLKLWLESNEEYRPWPITNDLRTMNLYDVVTTAVYVKNAHEC